MVVDVSSSGSEAPLSPVKPSSLFRGGERAARWATRLGGGGKYRLSSAGCGCRVSPLAPSSGSQSGCRVLFPRLPAPVPLAGLGVGSGSPGWVSGLPPAPSSGSPRLLAPVPLASLGVGSGSPGWVSGLPPAPSSGSPGS